MLSWAQIVYGAGLSAVAAGLLLLLRSRRPLVLVTGGLATGSGALAWNSILRSANGRGFFVDAPWRSFPSVGRMRHLRSLLSRLPNLPSRSAPTHGRLPVGLSHPPCCVVSPLCLSTSTSTDSVEMAPNILLAPQLPTSQSTTAGDTATGRCSSFGLLNS